MPQKENPRRCYDRSQKQITKAGGCRDRSPTPPFFPLLRSTFPTPPPQLAPNSHSTPSCAFSTRSSCPSLPGPCLPSQPNPKYMLGELVGIAVGGHSEKNTTKQILPVMLNRSRCAHLSAVSGHSLKKRIPNTILIYAKAKLLPTDNTSRMLSMSP